jgi:hypothetical protein
MLSQKEKNQLKLDAIMRSPMHDHNDTMLLKSSVTLETSSQAQSEGYPSKAAVRVKKCHTCGKEEISVVPFWSTLNKHTNL